MGDILPFQGGREHGTISFISTGILDLQRYEKLVQTLRPLLARYEKTLRARLIRECAGIFANTSHEELVELVNNQAHEKDWRLRPLWFGALAQALTDREIAPQRDL